MFAAFAVTCFDFPSLLSILSKNSQIKKSVMCAELN